SESLLVYTLTRDKTVTALFAKTRAAWMRGDVGALSTTNASLRQANPGIAQRLVAPRNPRGGDRIEKETKTGKPTAVVAGAAHFSGPGSVIAILEERGYKIEQL